MIGQFLAAICKAILTLWWPCYFGAFLTCLGRENQFLYQTKMSLNILLNQFNLIKPRKHVQYKFVQYKFIFSSLFFLGCFYLNWVLKNSLLIIKLWIISIQITHYLLAIEMKWLCVASCTCILQWYLNMVLILSAVTHLAQFESEFLARVPSSDQRRFTYQQ